MILSKSKLRIFFTIVLIFSVFVSCNKDSITEEDSISEEAPVTEDEQVQIKKEILIDKISEFMPASIVNDINAHLEKVSGSMNNYSEYIDSCEQDLDFLISTIEANYSLSEFTDALNNVLENQTSLKNASYQSYERLGYAKSVEVDPGVSGSFGAILYGELHALGGGGIKIIYDFVNLDKEVYYYTLSSGGYSLGLGLAAKLEASIGFTGVNELLAGIPYHQPGAGLNKFEGPTKGHTYSISGALRILLGADVDLGIGISNEAYSDKSLPLAKDMAQINNGITSYSFVYGGSLSADLGGEFRLAYSSDQIGTISYGFEPSYKTFHSDRFRAGLRMANELLSSSPMESVMPASMGADLEAAALAIIYGNKIFSLGDVTTPSVATISVDEVTTVGCNVNGLVARDGASSITSQGFVWSASEDPTLENNVGYIESSNIGMAEYECKISGLQPNQLFYIRAYATNEEGTIYGESIWFRTNTDSESFIDPRDGNPYKTIQIGDQVWMAENLADDIGDGCWTFDSIESYVETYGRLYTLEAAIRACPDGWHLPSDAEWKQLEIFIGMSQSEADNTGFRGTDEGSKLKATSGWGPDSNGTDDYGFSGLPAGNLYYPGSFANFEKVGYWWSSTKINFSSAYVRGLTRISTISRREMYIEDGNSVRYVKN
ncbi:fibrobacter succinogenes major paralogous domain-containing protein [Sunxiuqinia sp. A32]|uniref:fibrobacter succinogenes major paralogous domain-containing protein n=1 Tax=Sunxiuqinia sp. A32 TaxID=3461496 RepID=UPI0040466042